MTTKPKPTASDQMWDALSRGATEDELAALVKGWTTTDLETVRKELRLLRADASLTEREGTDRDALLEAARGEVKRRKAGATVAEAEAE